MGKISITTAEIIREGECQKCDHFMHECMINIIDGVYIILYMFLFMQNMQEQRDGGQNINHNLRIKSERTTQSKLKNEEAWRLLANFEVDRRGTRSES